MSDAVRYEKRGPVARLTLSNPAERNALTGRMRRELIAALAGAEEDPEIRAVLLRGAGDRSFCAGGSMSDMAELRTREDSLAMSREGVAALNALSDFSKPLVAAVSGWCVGDGFELALCCDLVLAAENAVFFFPEVDLGLTMGWGGAFRLAKRIGLVRARELLMLGTRLTAREAADMGIINRVCPAEELYPRAEALTSALAEKPPLALKGIKALLAPAMLDGDYAASQEFGAGLVADLMMTRDFREAVAAFGERRTPEVHGQ